MQIQPQANKCPLSRTDLPCLPPHSNQTFAPRVPKKELPHSPFLFSLWAKHLYLNLYARWCSAVSLILFLLYFIVEEMKALARSRKKGLAPRPHTALRKYSMHELMKKIMRAPTFLVLSYQCTQKKPYLY